MTWVTLTERSKNVKTGPIAVSMTDKNTCPKECSLKDKDCYARFSYLGIAWQRLTDRKIGDNWDAFCERLKKIPAGKMFRHCQAGDMPKNSKGKIHLTKARKLWKSARHLMGFGYTHFNPLDPHNRKAIDEAKESGFCLNLSADNLTQADKYAKIGPTVVTLPSDAPKGLKTPNGLPIVICPAQTNDLTCEQCKLCAISTRKSIVGFRAHGTAKKRLSEKLK